MLSITTIKNSRKSYPDGLDARKRAWLPEQAYSRSTLQKKRTSVYQKAETQCTQGSCLSCCFTPLEQQNPSEPTALTHHGTSPNSGMYLLGKFSRGTPKTFTPLIKSLSFLPSMLFTVIPWRTWRWKRITLLSVTFMLMNSVRRSVYYSNPSLTEWTTEDSFITLIHITWASGEKEVKVLCSGSTGRVVNLNFDSSGLTIMSLFLIIGKGLLFPMWTYNVDLTLELGAQR